MIPNLTYAYMSFESGRFFVQNRQVDLPNDEKNPGFLHENFRPNLRRDRPPKKTTSEFLGIHLPPIWDSLQAGHGRARSKNLWKYTCG